jgi:hypothetical protein
VANGERTWRLDKGWRAREIRSGDGGRKAKKTVRNSLGLPVGLLVAQRFLTLDHQFAVLERILEGRLSLEYLSWNGRTDNDSHFANLR